MEMNVGSGCKRNRILNILVFSLQLYLSQGVRLSQWYRVPNTVKISSADTYMFGSLQIYNLNS